MEVKYNMQSSINIYLKAQGHAFRSDRSKFEKPKHKEHHLELNSDSMYVIWK